jgi:hypothetical protein
LVPIKSPTNSNWFSVGRKSNQKSMQKFKKSNLALRTLFAHHFHAVEGQIKKNEDMGFVPNITIQVTCMKKFQKMHKEGCMGMFLRNFYVFLPLCTRKKNLQYFCTTMPFFHQNENM